MKFITVRDLRNKPAQVRQSIIKEKDVVLTSNGKPFAIVTLTSEETLEKNLEIIRRLRAENAVSSMQEKSLDIGTNQLSLDKINAEIKDVRKKRK
ncbi:MAG: type II toxin-antitoxin system Phd/YefM family antitoxin [Candidatus Omnitrophota bacterium]